MSVHRPVFTAFAGLQWLGFMFANTVVIPLSVGSAFHLTQPQISGLMSRSFVMTGLACLLQVWLGHRWPLMEGQSGLWWGVVLNLAAVGNSSGMGIATVGGSLAVGMVGAGVLISVAGLAGLHHVLQRLFSPIVMAVLLMLLSAQLMDIFLRGMLGMDPGGQIRPAIALLSIVLAVGVTWITVGTRSVLSNFSILIGLAVGWLAHIALFGAPAQPVTPRWQDITTVFAWGAPTFHAGIILTAIIAGFINTTNTIATLRAAEPLLGTRASSAQYRRSFALTGLFTALSGPLSLIPYAPYTSSIGFLRTTRLTDRVSFATGAVLFIGLGLVPSLSGLFATLPINVGDAVLLVAYVQLFGAALQNLEGIRFTFRTIFRIAVPVLTGIAILGMPAQAFVTLPSVARALLGNGMLVGILISVILENTVRWDRLDARAVS